MTRGVQNLVARLEELEAAGCPTLLREGIDLGRQLRVNQVGVVTDSLLFDLRVGTGYIIDLEVINDLPTPTYLRDVEPQFPWGSDPHFRWLEPGDLRENVYRLPGSTLEYPRNETLNDFLAGTGRVGPNEVKSGLLLGFGGPMPSTYVHGMLCNLKLVITDQHDECWTQAISLWVDRTEKMRQQKRKRPSRTGLFEPCVTQASEPKGAESTAMPTNIARNHAPSKRTGSTP